MIDSGTIRRGRAFLVAFLSGIGLITGFAFAVMAPVDNLLAGGHMLRSASCFVAGSWLAMRLAPRVGLVTGVKRRQSYLRVIFVPAISVAMYVIVIDALLFRSILPTKYVDQLLHDPIWARLPAYCARAFYESLMYRLFVGTMLAWCFNRGLGRRGPASLGVVVLAMLVAQMINIGANVLAPNWPVVSPLLVLWIFLRFVLPGTLWGYLYYRHGLVISEYVAAITHIFLQPLIGPALAMML